MSLLPSPIPHPLDYSPFDVPDWAYEALEWVVGFQPPLFTVDSGYRG